MKIQFMPYTLSSKLVRWVYAIELSIKLSFVLTRTGMSRCILCHTSYHRIDVLATSPRVRWLARIPDRGSNKQPVAGSEDQATQNRVRGSDRDFELFAAISDIKLNISLSTRTL